MRVNAKHLVECKKEDDEGTEPSRYDWGNRWVDVSFDTKYVVQVFDGKDRGWERYAPCSILLFAHVGEYNSWLKINVPYEEAKNYIE